ncbi:MAG: hypothetical protein SF029_10280 [bacterium]|nr:hypothetical protein [bacterium]
MKKKMVLVLLAVLLLVCTIAPALTVSAAGNEGPSAQATKTLTTWRSLGNARYTQRTTWSYNGFFITSWSRTRIAQSGSGYNFRYFYGSSISGGVGRYSVTLAGSARFSRYFWGIVIANWYPYIRQTLNARGGWSSYTSG